MYILKRARAQFIKTTFNPPFSPSPPIHSIEKRENFQLNKKSPFPCFSIDDNGMTLTKSRANIERENLILLFAFACIRELTRMFMNVIKEVWIKGCGSVAASIHFHIFPLIPSIFLLTCPQAFSFCLKNTTFIHHPNHPLIFFSVASNFFLPQNF
jgi:hypothetical protein